MNALPAVIEPSGRNDGFKPASFYKNVEALRAFPDEPSITHLRSLGVTHVVVDSANMARPALERLGQFSDLQLLAEDATLRLYLLTRVN